MSTQNLPRYLYRALRPEEITAGNVLIPKAQKPFLEPARLPQISPLKLGDSLNTPFERINGTNHQITSMKHRESPPHHTFTERGTMRINTRSL